jgi:hypothetical protein
MGGGVLGVFFEELGEKKIPAQNFKLDEDMITATPKRVITSVTLKLKRAILFIQYMKI